MRAFSIQHSAFSLLVALTVAGCETDFESPSIVIDLRMLGAQAEPAEVIVPIDADPESFPVPDIDICALVADPGASRELAFEMVACAPTESGRCDEPDEPFLAFDSGVVDDPDEAPSSVSMCGTLRANPVLVDIIELSIEDDPTQGFSSVAVQIEMFVKPSGGSDADGIYGFKRALFGPQLPAERTANTNPTLDDVLFGRDPAADPTDPVTLRRCADDEAAPIEVAPEEVIELIPVEPEGVREDYVLPTFDGGSRMFTENMSYAWFATDGEFNRETTGGPKDPVGNVPLLETEWTAPQVDEVTDVDLWVVMRDERGGSAWYEMCVRVDPGA